MSFFEKLAPITDIALIIALVAACIYRVAEPHLPSHSTSIKADSVAQAFDDGLPTFALGARLYVAGDRHYCEIDLPGGAVSGAILSDPDAPDFVSYGRSAKAVNSWSQDVDVHKLRAAMHECVVNAIPLFRWPTAGGASTAASAVR